MMKKKMVTTYQLLLLLGILSAASGDDKFLSQLFDNLDYGNLPPVNTFLKEKCAEDPDADPCHYVDSITEEINDFTQQSSTMKSQKNSEVTTTSDTTLPPKLQIPSEEENPKEEIFIEIPIPYPESNLEKRFSYRRGIPLGGGYKRGPGFRSWGGKRDPAFAVNNQQKRSKFTSWGGKRGGDDVLYIPNTIEGRLDDKRTKFTNWGGKRDDFEETTDRLDKKSQFRSWGGKRNGLDGYNNGLDKKSQFRSWGGKRDGFEEEEEEISKRNQFQSWGGKRDGFVEEDVDKKNKFRSWGEKTDNSGDETDKRSKFRSWGGKKRTSDLIGEDRRSNSLIDPTNQNDLYLRYQEDPFKQIPRRPQSWKGKRTPRVWYTPLGYYFYPNLTPKLYFKRLLNGEKKRKFSSWGGKRSDDEVKNETDKRGIMGGSQRKKNVLQNWGGKRSEGVDVTDEDHKREGNLAKYGWRDKRKGGGVKNDSDSQGLEKIRR